MEHQMYDIKITCVGGKGPCDIGIKPGREWLMDDRTPGGMCSLVYNANFPVIWGMMNGASFPWQDDPEVTWVSCTNPKVNNVYEIRRMPKKK